MSLLAWYPLIANGNNQGLDGIDLTPIGTITYTAGKLGNAPTFTQNLANRFRRPQIKIKDNFSFACWFKLDTTESTTWQTLLFEGRDVNSDGWGFRINGSNKRLIYCCGSSTWTYGTDLTMGQWYHATMVVKDGVYTAYLNGTQVNTATITTLPALTEWGTYFYVSCLSDSYYPLMGQVQDVRIYDHPLSKKEVKEISKGLTIHLPMSWGLGKSNMIKNSYTWMNKNAGSHWVSTGAITKAVLEDDTAPCKWIYKVTKNNSEGTASANGGAFYGNTAQGVELTDLVEGETYTYSFWAKADSSNDTSFNLQAGSVCESQTLVSSTGFTNLDSNWRKHTVTFKWTKTTKLTACFYCTTPAGKTQIFYCCGLKLEKGDMATPYIPHITEAAYTSKGYADMFKMECSGYNRTVTVNSNNTISMATDSPRGTGTNINKTGKLTVTGGMPVGTFPVYTVNAWIRTTADATQTLWNDFFGIAAKNYAGNDSLFRMEVASTNGGAFNWFGPMQKDAGGLFSQGITVGEWTMITLVSDGTKHIGYKNGVQYGTSTPVDENKANWTTKGDFYIGDSTIYFDVADVRVYATALSVDDIKELYQIPVQIDKTGKVYCNNLVEV